METVTSTRNTRVRSAAALVRRRERRERARHLVEGPNAVGEALAAGVVETLFGTGVALIELERSAATRDVEVVAVSDHVLDHLADTATPQGVVAVARNETAELAELPGGGLVVVLDRVADPGNVGGIVRTADAAGAVAVVCTEGCADVLGPKAVRAAAGSTYHLPLVVGVTLAEVADAAAAHGRQLLGLDGRADRSVLSLGPSDLPIALVLGNEAHGLDDGARAHLDGTLAVPMRGRAESLNVAAAAAIAIYAAAGSLGQGEAGSR